MLTYMAIQDDFFDFEDLESYMMLPMLVIADILLILFQPIFYIIYKKKKMEWKNLWK